MSISKQIGMVEISSFPAATNQGIIDAIALGCCPMVPWSPHVSLGVNPGEDSMAGAAAAGNVDTEYAVPWNGRRNESERVGTSQGGLKPADFLEISEISEISTEFCRILMF